MEMDKVGNVRRGFSNANKPRHKHKHKLFGGNLHNYQPFSALTNSNSFLLVVFSVFFLLYLFIILYTLSFSSENEEEKSFSDNASRFLSFSFFPFTRLLSLRVIVFSVRGDLQFSEKSKKEKVRSLSAVGRALSTSQMLSPKQPSNTLIPTKNFLNGCNASVPRKLRSATKKRSRESVLLDSEKVNHKMNGIESPKKDNVKKFKKKQGMRVQREGPITKDEEEVAETLYALAGMFSDNSSNHISRESLPDNNNNSSVLQELEEDNASAALQASATVQGASTCCPESSHGEAYKISCLNEAVVGQEQLDLPESAKFLMPSHSASPTINLQTMPVMVKCENSNKVALHESELCLSMGLNIPRQQLSSQNEMKPDLKFEAARDIDCRKQQQNKEQKGNEGLSLWPGLSSVAPAGQTYLQSSATKKPDWLDTAISASKQDLMETSTCSSSGRKVSEVAIHKIPWKRCAAHVHISHIIQSLEVPKRHVIKETELYECHQMRAHEGSKRGVLLEVHNIYGMRNGVTSSATFRNHPHESKNVNVQQQCHYRDISKAAPTPVVYDGPQKQNFNFLTLSAGRNSGLKVANHNYNKIGNRLERLSKLQVPYFQSLAQQQQQGVMPNPTAQSQYATSSYLDQLSVAGPQVLLQQPHYYGSPLCGTHYSSTVSNKQEHQSFWGLQQAVQGSKSSVNFNIMRTQYPNWQSGRHDSSSVNPCAQATLPCSPESQEIFGSKIASISSGQQHQLLAPYQDKWTRTPSPFCM